MRYHYKLVLNDEELNSHATGTPMSKQTNRSNHKPGRTA